MAVSLAQRRAAFVISGDDKELLDYLAEGPQSMIALTEKVRYSFLLSRQIESLGAQRLILQAGFTPTDALHVLGQFELWNTQASQLGAELLAARAGLTPGDFCRRVVSGVSDRVATELVSKVLSDEGTLPDWKQGPCAEWF